MNFSVRNTNDDTILVLNSIIIKNNIKSILDLGCGNGSYHSYLYCKDIVGIDSRFLSDNIINHNIEDFPYPLDRTFDMVVLLDVIEHVFDPINLLEKLRLYCSKYLFISVPNKDCIDDIINRRDISIFTISDRDAFDGRWCFDHIRFFNLKSITELLEYTGYKPIYVTGSNCFASRFFSRIIHLSDSEPATMARKLGEEFVEISPNIIILSSVRSSDYETSCKSSERDRNPD